MFLVIKKEDGSVYKTRIKENRITKEEIFYILEDYYYEDYEHDIEWYIEMGGKPQRKREVYVYNEEVEEDWNE